MWYVFPQVDGLGSTENAKLYAIKSVEEAQAYLNHPVLGKRLQESCEILLNLEGLSISDVLEFPDDLKLKSSMTLFAYVSLPDSIFAKVLDRFFDGAVDPASIEIIDTLQQYHN